MPKSTFVKVRKINSIASNIRYLADQKEHPETCITYSTCDDSLWSELARVNQEAFVRSNQEGKCVEARECIFVCPEEFYKMNDKQKQRFLEVLIEGLKKRMGVEVYGALHAADKDEKNMHVHAMYMERKKVTTNEKIATRRLYFDDEGRQVKSRKYAVDEKGELLPGYSFVRKGEKYGETEWTAKDKYLRGNTFTENMKKWWTYQLNSLRAKNFVWTEGMEERVVYDRKTSPYFALQDEIKPFKYRDNEKCTESVKSAETFNMNVRRTNKLKKQYNEYVDVAKSFGASETVLLQNRLAASKAIRTAYETGQSNRINEILDRAIKWIVQFIDRLKPMEKGFRKASSIQDKIAEATELQKKQNQHSRSTRSSRSHDDWER